MLISLFAYPLYYVLPNKLTHSHAVINGLVIYMAYPHCKWQCLCVICFTCYDALRRSPTLAHNAPITRHARLRVSDQPATAINPRLIRRFIVDAFTRDQFPEIIAVAHCRLVPAAA